MSLELSLLTSTVHYMFSDRLLCWNVDTLARYPFLGFLLFLFRYFGPDFWVNSQALFVKVLKQIESRRFYVGIHFGQVRWQIYCLKRKANISIDYRVLIRWALTKARGRLKKAQSAHIGRTHEIWNETIWYLSHM